MPCSPGPHIAELANHLPAFEARVVEVNRGLPGAGAAAPATRDASDAAAPAGFPAPETAGGPVPDLDLPPPVIAAADAASTVLGGLCSGLIRLTGEISRRRSGAT